MTTKQEASTEIATKVKLALALVKEAEALADKHDLEFEFSVSYGMGGWYNGGGKSGEDWDSSNTYDEPHGWAGSSQSC